MEKNKHIWAAKVYSAGREAKAGRFGVLLAALGAPSNVDAALVALVALLALRALKLAPETRSTARKFCQPPPFVAANKHYLIIYI